MIDLRAGATPGAGNHEALRAQLRKLRGGPSWLGEPPPEAGTPRGGRPLGDRQKRGRTARGVMGGTLALQDVKEELCVPPEPRKKRKRVKKKVAKDPGAQLLAQAEQLRVAKMQEVRQKKKRKEKRGGEKARALVKALLGGQKKQKTSGRDGGPVELSRREPCGLVGRGQGGVLKLKRAFGALTEEGLQKGLALSSRCSYIMRRLSRRPRGTRGDDGSQNDLILQLDGPSLLQRLEPRHEGAQPSGYLPGRAAGGRIGEAGRFPCFPVPRHSYSRQRRHWKSAQYLELHPLEPTQGAPMSLLLEAKKHGRLGEQEPGSRRREGGADEMATSWRAAPRGGESKSKDKGKAAARREAGRKEKEWWCESEGQAQRKRRRRGPMRPKAAERSEGEEVNE